MSPDFDCNPREFRGDEIDAEVSPSGTVVRDFLATVKREAEWREAPIDQAAVDSFVHYCKQGRAAGGAGSTGERAAASLGRSLLKDLTTFSDLDGQEIRGLCELIRVASTGYAGMGMVQRLLGASRSQRKGGK